MEKIIGSLKEFIWDIIGYLIPGFLMIITLNFFLVPTIAVENNFLFDWNVFNTTYIIIVVAYVLGFFTYSLSMVKNDVQDFLIDLLTNTRFHKRIKKYHSKEWEISFLASELFKAAKQKLEDDGVDNALIMSIKEVRNVFMSKNPEMDQKVYTFMFRSDLFSHISTIIYLVIILFISQLIFNVFEVKFLRLERIHLVLILIFPLFLIPLGNAKRKFYSMSQRIPFSKLF